MKTIRSATAAIALVSILPIQVSADDAIRTELTRCKAVASDDARLTCYDGIGMGVTADSEMASEVESDVVPAVEAVVVDSAGSAPTAPPDELGAETLNRGKDNKDEPEPAAATVIRCTKDSFKKYYFHLEGGQVWKQLSSKKLRYKEDCNFNVSIVKDFFGYKMQAEGEKSRIRVSRIR